MSLLAEPRRKRKIGPDPNNKNWTEDSSKFGQKMLEKMGWSKGKGLGAADQGRADPISVNPNSDARGLGSKHNSDDNWLDHQNDYDALLKSLNDQSQDQVATKQTQRQSKEHRPSGCGSGLESMSKKSKSRIHYHKFTRGKDLSNLSAEDRSSIFGKKKKVEETVEIVELNEEINKANHQKNQLIEAAFQVSTVSTQDYYKQVMEQKLRKCRDSACFNEIDELPLPHDKEVDDVKKKKKKSKKKPKKDMDE